MNFTDMKMAIQLDRSFLSEAIQLDLKFSTPHFISMLSNEEYLKNDGNIPMTRHPIFIDEGNLEMLSGVINGERRYQFPVVYVSKKQGQL